MTSFGWKRKVGEKVSHSQVTAFEQDAATGLDPDVESGDVDWLNLAPKRRVIQLEDTTIKSQRLVREGSTLAENDRYWEALRKWDEALRFSPDNSYSATIYEMKSQVYLCLNEIYPSVNAAEKAVELNPCWWMVYQTLGRAQLGLGEVRLAVKSFSRAIHLSPDKSEVWNEDLRWAWQLLEKKRVMENFLKRRTESDDIVHSAGPTVKELSDEQSVELKDLDKTMVRLSPQCKPSQSSSGGALDIAEGKASDAEIDDGLSSDYVVMRG